MADKEKPATAFKKAFDRPNWELIKAALASSPTWNGRIPELSQDLWSSQGVALSSDAYSPLRNEVFNALMNRIGETIIQIQDFANPLRIFKRGTMIYGDTVQEMAVDVIAQEEFQGGADFPVGQEPDQFARAPSDVVAAYHRINREAMYRITIDDPRMRRAFIEPRGLYNLLDEKVAMLEKSNIIDEFIYTKKLIVAFAQAGGLQKNQICVSGDINTSSSAEQVRQWLIVVKKALRLMTFPQRGMTKSNIMTQTSPDDLVIILRYDIPIINEVSNLSQAFHAEFMDINIPILSVDNFSDMALTDPNYQDSDIIGAIVDRRALQIRENYRSMTTADNARALYRNYFLHVWQTYLASPLKPVVYICKTGNGLTLATPPAC